MKKTWDTIAIVGVGLIGGAIGQGALRRGLAKRVIGVGRREESLKEALAQGALSEWTTDISSGVAKADLIILCAPPDLIAEHARSAALGCPAGALITDAASTKQSIVTALQPDGRGEAWKKKNVRFLGGHPLAGGTAHGPQAASGDLFVDRVVVLTPTSDSTTADRQALTDFWTALGAKVVEMTAEAHDQAVAFTSHAPRLISSAIAGGTPNEYVTLTAGGWLDTTRIAAGDPALWRQILLDNRSNVLRSLEAFQGRLDSLRSALEKGDGAALEKLLTEAKQVRDAVGS